jgi:hypothetical protein
MVDVLTERDGQMVPVLITDKTIQCFPGNTPYVTITIPGLEVSVELALNIIRNEDEEYDVMVTTVEGRPVSDAETLIQEGLPEILVPADCPITIKVIEVLGHAWPPRAFSVEISPRDPDNLILKFGKVVKSTITQMQLNSARNVYVLDSEGRVIYIAHIKLVNGVNGLEVQYREKEIGTVVEVEG